MLLFSQLGIDDPEKIFIILLTRSPDFSITLPVSAVHLCFMRFLNGSSRRRAPLKPNL
jgi:hypothetical protein